jgi:hypothetical protein
MVVMLLGHARTARATPPVRRLAVGTYYDIDGTILGEPLEMPVDRRQPDGLTLMAQLVVQRLRGAKAVGGGERFVDRGALSRRSASAGDKCRGR